MCIFLVNQGIILTSMINGLYVQGKKKDANDTRKKIVPYFCFMKQLL